MAIYEVNIIYTFHFTAKDDLDALKRANQIIHTREESKTSILFSKTVRLVPEPPRDRVPSPLRRIMPPRVLDATATGHLLTARKLCERLSSIDVVQVTWWRLRSRASLGAGVLQDLWDGPIGVTLAGLVHDEDALSYIFSDADLRPLLDGIAEAMTGTASGEFMLTPITRELVKTSDVNELREATARAERASPRDQPDSPWETVPLGPVEVYQLSPPDDDPDDR
jgi:hypothetical protein